jgi:hypothetical protein
VTIYPSNTGKISTDKLDIIVMDDYSLKKKTIHGKEVYKTRKPGKLPISHPTYWVRKHL